MDIIWIQQYQNELIFQQIQNYFVLYLVILCRIGLYSDIFKITMIIAPELCAKKMYLFIAQYIIWPTT